MPKDPNVLFSYINMKLRDTYPSLDELCASEGCKREDIEKILHSAGFLYDESSNRFAAKQL